MGTIPATSLKSYEEVDNKLFQLGQLQSKISKKEADMNGSIDKIKEKFNNDTLQERAEAELLKKDIEGFLAINKADFDQARTKKMIHGVVGFRFGTPKVLLLNKKFSMNVVLEHAKKIFKKKFIRTKEELDKDAILAAYSAKEVDDQKLSGIGLRIDKDESFVIEIDWESLETN